MSDFTHLLEPIAINKRLKLKNRMIKAPQSSWFFEEDGSAGDRIVGFYEALAKGGVGMSSPPLPGAATIPPDCTARCGTTSFCPASRASWSAVTPTTARSCASFTIPEPRP